MSSHVLQIAEFTLQSDRDATWSSQRARLLGTLAGLPDRRRSALGKAVAEIARLAAGGRCRGTITYALSQREEGAGVEVLMRLAEPQDSDQLQAAVNRAGQWVDEALLQEYSPTGAAISLWQALPAGHPPPQEADLAAWGTVLAMRSTRGALVTSQQTIRALRSRLEETARRGSDLEHELQQVRSLNETLELLALVASKTDNAVIIMDPSGTIEWVNDGFARITGFDAAEVRGMTLDSFFQSLAGEHVGREIQEAFRTGHGISHELDHRRKDGSTYWVSLNITPVFDETGATTRWIAIANDVTRRRQAQEELREARDQAEAANRAKSEFLANMSHEIRTPMNAIIGMTELALATPLSDEQHEYLITVKASAEALLGLLNDLLDLSKIEARKLSIEVAPFAMRHFLDETLKPLRMQARQQQLELRWLVAEEVPDYVLGDDGRLRQILVNLVGNALKFTHRGHIEVRLEKQWQSGEDVGLHFAVRDTGIGISAANLERIFEAFTQADRSIARQYGGTGLGLAICAHLAAQMGGRIWVESELGSGSTFHFTIRIRQGDQRQLDPRSTSRSSSDQPSAAVPLRVLVADDNPANRVLASRILEKRGHRVAQAADGRTALELLENHTFDLALLDVQMPELDGYETTAEIRRREQQSGRPSLPIVAMTAYAMKGDRERCLAAGMDGYIAKPIRAQDLVKLVEGLGGTQLLASPLERPPFDFRQALGRVEGDRAIFAEQVDLFLCDAPQLLLRIADAVAARSAHELNVAAHRMKGSAACFDAGHLVAAAAQLEQMGRSNDFSQADEVLRTLRECLAELQTALEEYRSTPPDV